jgi:hypothetical protein
LSYRVGELLVGESQGSWDGDRRERESNGGIETDRLQHRAIIFITPDD